MPTMVRGEEGSPRESSCSEGGVFGWVGWFSEESPCPAISFPSGSGGLELLSGVASPPFVPVGGAAGVGVEATSPGSEFIVRFPSEGGEVAGAGSTKVVLLTVEARLFPL